MYGFKKGDKHSYNDFKMRIINREFDPPAKEKIKETVPFMNGSYDFSNLYGEQTYEERVLKYTLDLRYSNKIEYMNKKIQISNWLNSGLKEPLYDDLIPGFYFLAECEGDIEFNEYSIGCEIIVKFICYPFMIRTDYEGNDIWDTFNFELDYAQQTKFTVDGTLSVEIYNLGSRNIVPTVVCDSSITVSKGSTNYIFNTGTTKDWRFSLNTGVNNLILQGNGEIEFVFYREVL